MRKIEIDSLIFDMDGTMWDAVDSYVEVWNVTFEQVGSPCRVSRGQLMECMGMTITDIVHRVAADVGEDYDAFMARLVDNERDMMPRLGGRLYPDIENVVKELAARYRIFMVSNCGTEGLPDFLKFTGLGPWVEDTLSNGETGLPKADNIRIIAERHGLKHPVYVGDTQGDVNAAHAAGIPVVHVTYGFGTAAGADYSADSPAELLSLITAVSK